MLLVNQDQGEPGHRRQHREPSAQNDARIAPGCREPRAGARDVLQTAVHDRQARFGKRLAETLLELRRQADFRSQHQRLRAAFQHPGDQVQVDLGLAAAGDAVQQERIEPSERRGDALEHGGLVLRQAMRRDERR